MNLPSSPPSSGIGTQLVRNSFWLLAQRAVDLILAFMFTWIALRRLGPENFGMITLTQAVLNLSILFTLNLDSSLVQIVPDLRKQGLFRNLRLIIGLNYLIKFSLGFLFASVLFLFAPEIAEFYRQPALAWMIPVGCLSFVAASLAEVGAETNLSLLHPEMRTLMTTLRRLVEVSGLILVTLQDPVPWKVILVLGVADTVAFLGYGIAALVFLRRLGHSNDHLSLMPLLRRMVRFSFPLLGARLAEVGSKELGKIILGALISPTLLGFYGVARLAVERLIDLFSQAPLAAVPVISGEKQTGEKNQVVFALFRYQAMVGVLVVFGLFSLTYLFLDMVGGPAYIAAAPVVRISSLIILFWSATAALHVNFLVHEKTYGILFLNGSQIAGALILYIVLIPLAQEKGAALADVFGQVVGLGLGLYLSMRWFGFPSRILLRQYLSLGVPGLFLLAPALLIGPNLLLSAVWLVSGGLLYLVYLVYQGFFEGLFDIVEKSPYFRGSVGLKIREFVPVLRRLRR